MKRISDNLNGTNENHIFPLFWQHGEDEQTLRDYLDKIEQSGIKAVCVEARPHPEFLGNKWWVDMDAIIAEAKSRNMTIWILDDAHFPTGYAAGVIKEKFPHFRKRFLKCHQLDFFGPMENGQAIIKYAFSDKADRLIGVFLGKKLDYQKVDPTTLIDITENVIGDTLVSFDLPEGEWSLMILVSTFTGGESQTEDYLNPIDPAATDVLIQTVYEAHYKKYKDEFGKTIKGFFSDEPRFGNMHGATGSIGRFDMVLPWREDMAALLDERCGFDCKKFLPLLFIDGEDKGHQMRYQYMELVSDMYSVHFNKRIGDWCREHGVEYIGHTIEDNNAHARLGYGAGHFFKAMAYQDMSGIDVVLHQLLPGMDHYVNKSMTQTGWDGEFFHYCLAKLGSSLGHMDPRKKGRTMCEVFGAYGWAEGNRMMKWIQNHMLVRGVNEFVPHAFNPGEYPDGDCPPHFYAHGKNPGFPEFKLLMDYTNRLSHLLSGGIHRAPVAISYHGEAEWSGDYMLIQKPAALLCRNQIDYDILPLGAMLETEIAKGQMEVNGEYFKALVIPYAQALPVEFLEKVIGFAKKGLIIYILEALPERASNGEDITAVLMAIENEANIKVIVLDALIKEMAQKEIADIKITTYEPYLRYYHYEQEDGHIFMFVNEHPYDKISTEAEIGIDGPCYWYDALENEVISAPSGSRKKLELAPYEASVLIFPKALIAAVKQPAKIAETSTICLSGPYEVAFVKSENYPDFKDTISLDKLVPLQEVEGKEDFAGVIRYETVFEAEKADITMIEVEGVCEAARVFVNDSACGVKIAPPYKFDVSEAIQAGINKLAIEVTTTLVREQYDYLSQWMLLEPTGITGGIYIKQSSFLI